MFSRETFPRHDLTLLLKTVRLRSLAVRDRALVNVTLGQGLRGDTWGFCHAWHCKSDI